MAVMQCITVLKIIITNQLFQMSQNNSELTESSAIVYETGSNLFFLLFRVCKIIFKLVGELYLEIL